MKRLFALAALAGTFAVAACDDPRGYEDETQDMAVEAPVAPAPEDTAVPTDATFSAGRDADRLHDPSGREAHVRGIGAAGERDPVLLGPGAFETPPKPVKGAGIRRRGSAVPLDSRPSLTKVRV